MKVEGVLTSERLAELEKSQRYHKGSYVPVIVVTPWQRQDGHDSIPFHHQQKKKVA